MKWKLTENEYIHDGTMNNFLTIVHHLIINKELPRIIVYEKNYEENLLNSPIFLQTENRNIERLINKMKSISKQSVYFIFTAFKSKNKDKEIIIFKYIVNILKYGNQLNYMKNKECVIKINSIVKQVNLEIHRFKGFLRFDDLGENILYAKFAPDNDIISNVAYEFKEKLREESWIIYDEKRNTIAVYDHRKIKFYYNFVFELKDIKNDEYNELWIKYFKKISIKERENKRCQKNFMPKRYWQNMLEVKENI